MPLLPLGLVLAAAAWIRLWAVPLSTGPDVAQFWGFAEVFRQHGVDFYRYACGNGDPFPYQGWAYVYPPVWLLVLGAVFLLVPDATASLTHTDIAWRWAAKTPIVVADLVIGVLIYRYVSGSIWKKLLFASLWLLNPAVWYQSAVFGQFDAIATALMFASFLAMERKHERWGFLLAGLAILTKQHTFIPLAMMMIAYARNMDRRQLWTGFGILAGVIIVFSVPFLLTGNFIDYSRHILLGVHAPGYQSPLTYAFSGTGAVLTWLHDDFGWNTLPYLKASVPVLIAALTGAGVLVYRRRIEPGPAMLIGILLFMILFYRINYQYLVIYMPLALLVASRSHRFMEKAVLLATVLLPIVWLWFFGTTIWFELYKPAATGVIPILERIGLSRWWAIPDSIYALLAAVLSAFYTWYIIGAFTRWRAQPTQVPAEK